MCFETLFIEFPIDGECLFRSFETIDFLMLTSCRAIQKIIIPPEGEEHIEIDICIHFVVD